MKQAIKDLLQNNGPISMHDLCYAVAKETDNLVTVPTHSFLLEFKRLIQREIESADGVLKHTKNLDIDLRKDSDNGQG